MNEFTEHYISMQKCYRKGGFGQDEGDPDAPVEVDEDSTAAAYLPRRSVARTCMMVDAD